MLPSSKAVRCVLIVFLLAACGSSQYVCSQAPDSKKKISSQTDLPRFSYPVNGPASGLLVADDATFAAFARKVGADVDTILATYAIDDTATLRMLLGVRASVQILSGDREGALSTLQHVRDLQEKPATRATSGLVPMAVLQTWDQVGAVSGPAYEKAFTANFAKAVDSLPWALAQDRVKAIRGSYQTLSTARTVSVIKAEVDPATAKSGSIDFESAASLLADRVGNTFYQPVQQQIVSVLTAYIAAHDVKKPDIWAAREVTLTEGQRLTPVRIAIWDGGVDTALFPKQLFIDSRPGPYGSHGIGFDTQGKLAAGDMQPLSAEQKTLYPKMLEIRQGTDDLQNGIDSRNAAEARTFLRKTPPDQLASYLANETYLDEWMHGTHVAGIALRGNPAARLVVVQFNDGLTYLPFAPTVEWANRFKADFQQIGGYLREHDVRVVNMSWADSQSEFEQWLTKTSLEKDPAVRKALAAQLYRIWKEGIEAAIRSAPNTLFVCAAGNSDSNAAFIGDVPASLQLPNLVTVGAVDQAGEETSFTSYGKTVVLYADGFQVESYVPGGTRLKLSGTSMASPNVVNLAAKLIALDPTLTPEKTISLMQQAAESRANGRLHVINPAAAVALLQKTTH